MRGASAEISVSWLANKESSFKLTNVSSPPSLGISEILLKDKSEKKQQRKKYRIQLKIKKIQTKNFQCNN